MQISALHTIIAAQQARPARPAAEAPSARAPASSSFAPLDFSKTANAAPTAAPACSANAPLGSQVDIRV